MALKDKEQRWRRYETPAKRGSSQSAPLRKHRRFLGTRFSRQRRHVAVSPSSLRREIFARQSQERISSAPGSTSDCKSRSSRAVGSWSSSRQRFWFRIRRCLSPFCRDPASSTASKLLRRNFGRRFSAQRIPVSNSNRDPEDRGRLG